VQLHPAGQDALCADTGEYERRAFDHWLEKTGSFVEEPWSLILNQLVIRFEQRLSF